MNRLKRPVLGAVLVLASASLAQAQTAEEIIEKSLAALGGRAAHGKLKSRVMAGTISLSTPAGDVGGTVEITNAVPNKVRTVIKADLTSLGMGQAVIDQRFDGSTAYVLDSLQGNREITGGQLDNLRNNSSFPHGFLNYKEMGTSVKLTGKEKVGDREAYVLLFDPTSGSPVRQFIDAETFMPLRAVTTVEIPQLGQEVEQTIEFLDYREMDGVKLPFRLRNSSTVQSITVTLSKVEHNVAVDDKMFLKPAQ
jgi:outer membrane lipoprotein-sorting protein